MNMPRLIVVLLLSLFTSLASVSAELPSDSIYQLDVPLVAQDGKTISMSHYARGPVLVSMFYASCPHICPTIVANLKQLKQRLPESVRERTNVLMISVDAERDSPQKLMELAERHEIELKGWSFATPSAEDVRAVASVLGVQYRKLPDGEFNHTSVIVLLDAKGRITARTNSISKVDEQFLAKILATSK